MKKCLSLILMLCLLTVNAFAAEVLQDNVAPELLSATVDQITVYDVGECENLEDAAVAALLNTALANPPASTNMVTTDLFYVGVSAEATVTFASDATTVLFTLDGIEWTALDAACADGAVTFDLAEGGVVAFQKPLSEVGTDAAPATENADPTTSSNFVPSVTGKLAPEVVPVDTAAAVVIDAEENEVATATTAELVITSLTNRANAHDVVVYEHLEWAYNSILNAGSMSELAEGLGENLVVSDLFAVSVYGEAAEKLNEEGNLMQVVLLPNLANVEGLTVLCSDKVGEWHVLPAENVIVYADGGVTLLLDHDGVVAFLVEASDAIPAEGAVTAP